MREGRVVRKLTEKMETELGLHCTSGTFRRTYAGYWQKRIGYPVWEVHTVERGVVVCCTPASECIKKCYRLELGFSQACGAEVFAEKIEEKE